MLHSDGKVQPLSILSVDLKAISFPIYPQLFCELFTNQYLMINGLGHVMQIQRDPQTSTNQYMWALSGGKEFKLETATILWRRENFALQLTDGIQRCDVACSRRNLYIIAVSTKPTIWWGETHGCMWTGQRLEHCNPLSYLSTAESCREIEGFKCQLKISECNHWKIVLLLK